MNTETPKGVMPLPLLGQVAVISGASAGIGRAYAKKLAEHGADIVSGDLNESPETKQLVEDAGRRFFHHPLDVSDEASVQAFTEAARAEHDRFDVLINDAGIYPYVSFDDMTLGDWHRVLATNLDGTFLMCKAFVPMMRRAKYGRIVNVCSSECWMNASRNLHYIASKMGVLGLSRALAAEVGGDNILVNCIAPGITDTKTVERDAPEYLTELPKGGAIKRPGQPVDMANVVAWLASPENSYMTAQCLVNDGGVVRL